jgi:ABC-type transport system involved in cytochrome c biogenesis permease subunit
MHSPENRSVRHFLPIAAAIGMCVFGACKAASAVPAGAALVAKEASRMLILDNERIKPLETFARFTLFRFSGRYSYRSDPAITWMCRTIFDPQSVFDDEVFLINNPEVAGAIGISARKNRRYSFNQLSHGLEKLENQARMILATGSASQSPADLELLRTVLNVREFMDLCSVFSFVVVKDDMAALGRATKAHAAWGRNFRVIPVEQEGGLSWRTPWEEVSDRGPLGRNDGIVTALVNSWRSYHDGKFAACANSLHAVNSETAGRVAGAGMRVHTSVELAYNAARPFSNALIAYAIGLFFIVIGIFKFPKICRAIGAIIIVVGFFLHSSGIIARVIIMQRPPVTTMYETFVFVAWTSVLIGFLIEVMRKKGLGLIMGSFSGTIFLYYARKFGTDGDTMAMLAPVLNNNFWLTTHIMTISLGYAGCFGAGVLAHVYLVKRVFLRQSREAAAQLSSVIYGVLAFGLTFTVIGTVLGGMWADQVWGRFWGWDPKENGALVIILWCAIVLHARNAKLTGQCGTAFGAIIALLLVMLAWVGVNLLGVGLHAYGFTMTGAKILLWVCVTEVLFLGAVIAGHFWQGRRERKKV